MVTLGAWFSYNIGLANDKLLAALDIDTRNGGILNYTTHNVECRSICVNLVGLDRVQACGAPSKFKPTIGVFIAIPIGIVIIFQTQCTAFCIADKFTIISSIQ